MSNIIHIRPLYHTSTGVHRLKTQDHLYSLGPLCVLQSLESILPPSTFFNSSYISNERSFFPLLNGMKEHNKISFFLFFLWTISFTDTYITREFMAEAPVIALEKQRYILNCIPFDSPFEALQIGVIKQNQIRG